MASDRKYRFWKKGVTCHNCSTQFFPHALSHWKILSGIAKGCHTLCCLKVNANTNCESGPRGVRILLQGSQVSIFAARIRSITRGYFVTGVCLLTRGLPQSHVLSWSMVPEWIGVASPLARMGYALGSDIARERIGYPPPPDTGKDSEYLQRGGRCANYLTYLTLSSSSILLPNWFPPSPHVNIRGASPDSLHFMKQLFFRNSSPSSKCSLGKETSRTLPGSLLFGSRWKCLCETKGFYSRLFKELLRV